MIVTSVTSLIFITNSERVMFVGCDLNDGNPEDDRQNLSKTFGVFFNKLLNLVLIIYKFLLIASLRQIYV